MSVLFTLSAQNGINDIYTYNMGAVIITEVLAEHSQSTLLTVILI